MRRASGWIVAACVLGSAAAQDIQVEINPRPQVVNFRDVAGVPFPKPPAGFRQPTSVGCSIIQGNDSSPSHNTDQGRYAWDYGVLTGTIVVASRSGVVVEIRDQSNVGGKTAAPFAAEGNVVILDHLDGTGSEYLHLERGSVVVRPGEYVLQGEKLGLSGDTGWAWAPHLHYSALDMQSGASKPSRFEDFKKREGVPRAGDSVKPAPKPTVSQEIIDRYRVAIRACLAARRAEHVGLAWRFAFELPKKRKRKAGYFYETVRRALQKTLRKELVELLERAAKEELPPPIVLRLLTALDKVSDRQIGARRATLLKAWNARMAKTPAWTAETRAAAVWVNGLRARYLEDRAAEADLMQRGVRLARGPLGDTMRQAAATTFGTARKRLEKRFARTRHEAGIVAPWHKRRILEDAKALTEEAARLRKALARAFPAERAAHKEWLQTLRKRQKEILAALAGR